jgi:hypothetical protein
MTDPVPKTSPQLIAMIVFLLTGIFILDWFTLSGILIPVLYTIPLLLTLQAPQRSLFLLVAAASTILTVVGLFVSAEGGIFWMAMANRSLAVITFVVAAAFYVQHKRVEGRLRSLQALLPYCSACKKVRDDRGYWKQLELYLEEHTVTQFSRGLCPECLPHSAT